MKKKKSRQSFKDLLLVIKQSKIPWFWIVLAFGVNLIYNDLLYALPVSTGKVMSGDLTNAALNEALIYFVLYSLIIIVKGLIGSYSKSLTVRKARGQLWGKMLRIREDYYDRIDSSEMLSAVTVDLGSAMRSIVNLCIAVIPDIWYVVRTLTTITAYHPMLFLTIAVFFPLKYIYMIVFGRKNYDVEVNAMQKVGDLTSTLGERMSSLPLIKNFNKEEKELKKGQKDIHELYKANVRIGRLGALSLAADNGISMIQQFVTMIVGVVLLQQNVITAGEWVTFFLFVSSLSTKFGTLIDDWMSLKIIHGDVVRPAKLFKAEDEDAKEGGTDMGGLENYDIVFEDVSFNYDDDTALSHINLTIPQGQKVAIVGNCGSGKSTALALLERFYQPQQGRITISGQEIGDMGLEAYRHAIAYVPQHNQVFTSSIRDVLTYGNRKKLTDEELRKASERTGFSDYIKLQTEGLDTEIFNGGENMSGGQLQRMIITREVLKDSHIVLFDEPTSALDAASARNVKDLILNDFDDKTVIVVTHDLSLTDGMDQIILLDDGELVSTGTYDELMIDCDKFRELVASQSAEPQNEDAAVTATAPAEEVTV